MKAREITITTARPDESRANGVNTVIAGIIAYLQERRLQPGDRLPSERDLALRLGVSRNVVREALATLVALRMIESRPNSGIYLRHYARESSFEALVMLTDMGATPTSTEVAETMEVRGHLEVLAARLACERRTKVDLERLQAILCHTQTLLEKGHNIVAADTDFHIALVEATHNSVLVRVLNAFYRFTSRRREAWFAVPAHGKASARDHRRLVEYVRQRDAGRAEALILRHMERARSYWSSVLAN